MTARNEIKVKSIGLKRLKSGQDIEILECNLMKFLFSKVDTIINFFDYRAIKN